MKRAFLKISALALCTTLSFSQEAGFDGYSYMGVGFNNVKYKEEVTTKSGTHVKSEAVSTDVYYITGGLVRLNDRYDFSYDLASTLYPNDLDEDVYINGAYQTNKADILLNDMTFLLHYKVTNMHRVVGGMQYVLNTYKRFDFISDPNQGVVEERSASLIFNVGYWYESTTAAIDGLRITAKALIGLPLWQKTTNTNITAVDFSDTGGYNAQLSLWFGYTMFPGLELGLGGGFDYMYRDGGGPKPTTINGVERNIYWPENSTETLYGVVSVTWNFR